MKSNAEINLKNNQLIKKTQCTCFVLTFIQWDLIIIKRIGWFDVDVVKTKGRSFFGSGVS